MEIEKVIRIVAVFIAVVAFAVCVADRLMFPASSCSTLPMGIVMLAAVGAIWYDTRKKESNQ